MKKFLWLVVALATMVLVGCDNPINSGINDSENEKIPFGWYEYTRETTSDLPEQKSVIIYINKNGDIERIGNEVWEYEKTALTNFKTLYKNLSPEDIRDDYFQITSAPNYKYLTILNDEKLDAGWYSYKTDNGATTNYIYLNSKGTVAIAGDTKRFDSDAMILLYEAFYSENISIQKTNIGFSTTQNNMAIEFSLTNEIPDWCKKFEYL